ncbi:MAG: hypothetical protein H0V53_08120 [Rubrobacter sp.]|nr:hypothetical protein [Rubrobacter sp.]
MEETKARVLTVLDAIPKGVLYSTNDWQRILGGDKRGIRQSLDELEAEGRIEIQKSGRPDKPLYRLKES